MNRYLMAIILALAAAAAPAADDDGVWNAGLAASFAHYGFDNTDLEDDSAGFKLFAGYRLNKWLGVEGAYHNFGDFDEDINLNSPGGKGTADIDGFSGSALLYAPLDNENFEVYGKAGYYFFDQEAVIDDAVVASNSPSGILLGAGGRLFVSEQFAVRGEAEWFDIDDGSLWALNIGFEYLFGRPAKVVAPAVAVAPAPAAAAPPPAPPPPPADADGDGVIDANDQCADTPKGDRVGSAGCSCDITRQVQFALNSADLTAEGEATLDEMAENLVALKFVSGTVVGHTDNSGSDEYNQRLSEQRAAAVASYLEGKNIAGGRLTTSGAGESEPIADNATAEGRAKNRRVVLSRTDCDKPN